MEGTTLFGEHMLLSPYPPQERNTMLYRLLQVKPTATVAEIESQYRKLAFKCHPDRCVESPKSQKLFQKLNQAKAILVDPKDRSEYDRHRAEDREKLQKWAQTKTVFCGGSVQDWLDAADAWLEQYVQVIQDHTNKIECGELPENAPVPPLLPPPTLPLSSRTTGISTTNPSSTCSIASFFSPRSVPDSPVSGVTPRDGLLPTTPTASAAFTLSPSAFNIPGVPSIAIQQLGITNPAASAAVAFPGSYASPTNKSRAYAGISKSNSRS